MRQTAVELRLDRTPNRCAPLRSSGTDLVDEVMSNRALAVDASFLNSGAEAADEISTTGRLSLTAL